MAVVVILLPAQVDECAKQSLIDDDDLQTASGQCSPVMCQLDSLIPVSPSSSEASSITATAMANINVRTKRERENDSMPDIGPDPKKHCPDDEEINAQVQSAIDSILNLQRSDPATDEAVRSILPS